MSGAKKPSLIPAIPFHPLVTVLIAFFILILPQIFVAILYVFAVQSGLVSEDAAEGISFYFILNAITEVITLGMLLLFLRTAQVGLSDLFGKVKVTLSTLGYVVLSFFGYFAATAVVLTIVSALVPSFNIDQNQENPFKEAGNSLEMVMSFFALVVIAPLAEEIIFRGYLYRALKYKSRPMIAAIVTSVLFGLAHLQWNVALDTFVLSLFLIWVYEKTGTLWSAVALHSVKNLIAFIAIFGPWQ